jgi:SAM-dependent methyltransferase
MLFGKGTVTAMPYQTFAEQGDSQSHEKLDRIKLPLKLNGSSVLDLGCNEGFFCLEAKRRGAAYVHGIDNNGAVIADATRRAEAEALEIQFSVCSMHEALSQKYDFILLLSALHYIDHPADLLHRIKNALTPNGTFILETGVAVTANGRTVSRALRSIDERFFPSFELLTQVWLRDYAVRKIGRSVAQRGDPVPRFIFHCTPLKTNVVFITGKGRIGKSSLAAQLGSAPCVSTDELLSPERSDNPRVAPAQKRFSEVFGETKSIWATWDRIKEEEGVKKYFGTVVSGAIRHCAGSGIVIVEGFIVSSLVAEIMKLLGPDFRYWETGQPTSRQA